MMLNFSDYPIIWGVGFVAGAVALIGFSRLIASTTASMSTVEQGFSKVLRIFLAVWVFVAIAYALLVGLDFTSFIPTLVIPLLIGTIALFRPVPTSILRCVPLHLLTLLGTYRIAGGVFVYAHFKHDLLSYGFAFNAGWGDVLTGVLAPLVAYAVYKRVSGAYLIVLIWTFIGIGDLIVAPISANLYGAQRLVDFPLNLIPLFLGPPFGILLHTITLRAAWLQLRAEPAIAHVA